MSFSDCRIFLNLATCDFPLELGNIVENRRQIEKIIEDADSLSVRWLLFPPLALTGASLGDLLGSDYILQEAQAALVELALSTVALKTIALVGLPISWQGQVYNCVALLASGRVHYLKAQTVLQEESRVFSAWDKDKSVTIELGPWQVELGAKDIFDDYYGCKLRLLQGREVKERAAFSSDLQIYFVLDQKESRVNSFAEKKSRNETLSRLNNCALVYQGASSGESSAAYVYTGNSMIFQRGSSLHLSQIDEEVVFKPINIHLSKIKAWQKKESYGLRRANLNGENKEAFNISLEPKPLELQELEIQLPENPWLPEVLEEKNQALAEIFQLLIKAINHRFKLLGNCRSVIGVSGGLDSTMTLLLASEALKALGQDSQNILGVTLPGFGTSQSTYDNALKMMEILQVRVKEIDIKPACLLHFQDIGQDQNVFDHTYENAQARERTQILMDLANKEGAIVLGSGDLSEIALGWCTYNADQMSMYNVNHSLTKGVIRELIAWYIDNKADSALGDVLRKVLSTPISPELLPLENGQIVQKTEEVLGPYVLHDFFLYYFAFLGLAPQEVLFLAEKTFAQLAPKQIEESLKGFLRRFLTQQFKRNPLPDGARVMAFGFNSLDWQMPSDLNIALWLQQFEE